MVMKTGTRLGLMNKHGGGGMGGIGGGGGGVGVKGGWGGGGGLGDGTPGPVNLLMYSSTVRVPSLSSSRNI